VKRHNSIIVVVDKLTTATHFIPVKTTHKEIIIAEIYMKEVVKIHGVPKEIVSKRYPKFTYNIWKGLFKGIGTNLNLITTHHPKLDGKIERTNRIIEDMCIMYVKKHPSKWEDYIHLVEFSYNNGYQASLEIIPFEALYGGKCNTLVIWDNSTDIVVIAKELLKEMKEQMEKIKQNLEAGQDRKKFYADKNIVFKDFKMGEHVFFKVESKRSSLRLGSCPKLSARYCGPFEILGKTGKVGYMLAFSASVRVHNVFHVSLLKKCVCNPDHIIDCYVIHVEYEGDFRVEPVRILDRKVKMLRNKSIGLVKVQWTYYGPKDATWENEENMQEE
jgi:hypothetical protein